MSNLTDEKIEWLRSHTMSCNESQFQSVLTELQRHRAAHAASKERVNQVVWDACCRFAHDLIGGATANAIASRVADQLATSAIADLAKIEQVILAALVSAGTGDNPTPEEIRAAAKTYATRIAEHLASPADRKPSLSERRSAHGMREPTDEERRDSIECHVSALPEIVDAASRRFDERPIHRASIETRSELATPAVLSAVERDMLGKIRDSYMRIVRIDYVRLLDRLLGDRP